jgi:hypothetical protein
VRAAGLALLLTVFGLGLLGVADVSSAGNGGRDLRQRAALALAEGDHLHFAIHILAGRAFDLCPCTRRAADGQYNRARFHAVTPRQRSVVGNTHPQTPTEWVDYVVGPVAVASDWIGDGISWLAAPGGQGMAGGGGGE